MAGPIHPRYEKAVADDCSQQEEDGSWLRQLAVSIKFTAPFRAVRGLLRPESAIATLMSSAL